MPALAISLPQMVDLALATPTLGGMNLGVLHSLMQIVIHQLGLSDCRVEFHGEQSDVFETLVSRMPNRPLVKVEEFEIDSSDALKRNPVSKVLKNDRRIFTINQQEITDSSTNQIPPGFPLQPIHMFDDEELASQSIHDRVGPILPKPEDLLHERDADENAIFDMFKMLNLEKRLEAVEEALKSLGAMRGTSNTSATEGTTEQIENYQNLISELMERVGNIEQALTTISIAPMRPSLESGPAQRESYLPRLSATNRGESLRPSLVLGQSSNLDLKLPGASPEDFVASFEDLGQIIKDLVKNMFCNDDFMVEDCQWLTRVKNKLRDELRDQLFETMNSYLGNEGHIDHSRNERQSAGVAEYSQKWFRKCTKLTTQERSPYQVSNRIENYDDIVRRMLSDEFFLDLLAKQLGVKCHCPVDIPRVKDIKDIIHRLSLLEKDLEDFQSSAEVESWGQFKDTLTELRGEIAAIKDDYAKFRADFLKTIKEVHDIMDCKIDKHHVPAIKHFVVSEIDKLQSKLDALLNKKLTPEATIGRFSLLEDIKCASCQTEVCMKDRLYPASVPKYPKVPQSKVLPTCFKPQIKRFCGGRFTVTKPEDRLWRSGNFLDQFNVLPPSQDVFLAKGTSGRIFRVDPSNSECVCSEPVVQEGNQCDSTP